MEAECSRCHRKFRSSTEEMTVCPDCLREEFAPAQPIEEEFLQAIKQNNDVSVRRATARAERLSGSLQRGTAFGPHGALRFVLGVAIFFVCVGIFMYCAGLEEWELRQLMPEAAHRPVSILLCWVAAALVFSSISRVSKLLVYPLVIFFVVAGWFMPTFWFAMSDREKKETAAAIAASTVDASEAGANTSRKSSYSSRELTEEDLSVYREKKQEKGSNVNFGIYISTRDVGLRQNIRSTIARLLEADGCVAYTKGQGTLFIVSNAAGGTRNISHIAARFGDLNYANPSDGLYEVAFLPEKVKAISRFDSEVLTSPKHASFVAANLDELRNLLDPHRVRAAASALATANLQEQAAEIREALIEVLRDPWAVEPDTYDALVQALVVYASPGDKEIVDVCRKYFLHSRLTKRPPSVPVMELLIRETPDEMVAPVVELWSANPVEWERTLAQLGTRSQEHLLDLLGTTESLQLIGSILKHLEHNGTPEAIPAVKPYAEHPDTLISRTARATLHALGASGY